MTEQARHIAVSLLEPGFERAIKICEEDRSLAESVSSEAAELLVARTRAVQIAREPDQLVWMSAQHSFPRMASASGADCASLARSLFFSLTRLAGVGVETREVALAEPALRWLLKTVPKRVEGLVNLTETSFDEPPFYAETHFVYGALWRLSGEQGARWLIKLVQRNDTFVGFRLQEVWRDPELGWSAEDWTLRLNAICEDCRERPGFLRFLRMGRPPAGCAPALVRAACTYADDPTDPLLRTVAEIVAGHRSGVAEDDIHLYWWEGAERSPDRLRWVLEISAAAGIRQRLVAAAFARGLIDESQAATLGEPVTRPAWADGEVPWKVSEVVDAGEAHLPDGRLSGGDPWWSFYRLPWTVELQPGRYRVRVIVAHHPLFGLECAAAELTADPEAEVVRWDLVEPSEAQREGYVVEVGVASFAAAALLSRSIDLEPAEGWPGVRGATRQVDYGEKGSIVMFTVGPQHQECRTWIGSAEDGHPVALVTDLGLLDLDPVTRPLPWPRA